jgi:hypothetical protein
MYDFIVEDGTGLDNSTSYVSIAEADDYAAFIGDMDWLVLSLVYKEYALMITTTFVDNLLSWNGVLLNQTQALNFPRKNLYDNQGRLIEGVPKAIKNAVLQLAMKDAEELSYQTIRLKEQVFGSASEKYHGSFVEDDSILQIQILLSNLGYGYNPTSFITLQRA